MEMKQSRVARAMRKSLTNSELEKLASADFVRLKLSGEERSRLREINLERERLRVQRSIELQAEEAPIRTDLHTIGLNVESVWDLANTSTPYPNAIPVLLKHLRRSYSDRIVEGIARALAVPDARYAWPLLLAEYGKTASEINGKQSGAKSGLAVALAATVSENTMDELIMLARDQSHGDSRLLLLKGIRKSKSIAAERLLHELALDPVFSKEIASWKKKNKTAFTK